MSGFFRVKNFEQFQHYKDRTPPWIRLYNALLDDYEFGKLPDASKAHLIAIWLLASRYDNKIPYDAQWVARRINATTDVDLTILQYAGFIILEQGCSETLADRKQVANPEESRGEAEERRKEVVLSEPPPSRPPSSEAEAIVIEAEILCGITDRLTLPEGFCGFQSRIEAGMAAGWTREDVLNGVRKGLATLGKVPRSFKYFEGPIAQAFADRTAPIPIAQPRGSNAKPAQRSAIIEHLDQRIAEFREAEQAGGDGPGSSRLLSHG